MGRILATAPERAAKVTVARLIIAQQTGGFAVTPTSPHVSHVLRSLPRF